MRDELRPRQLYTLFKVMLEKEKSDCKRIDWEDVDFGIGRRKRKDGTWSLWTKKGKRIDVIFGKGELILKQTGGEDFDRPRIKIEKSSIEWQAYRRMVRQSLQRI